MKVDFGWLVSMPRERSRGKRGAWLEFLGQGDFALSQSFRTFHPVQIKETKSVKSIHQATINKLSGSKYYKIETKTLTSDKVQWSTDDHMGTEGIFVRFHF